ncbi:SH3 domain-containing protein [Ectobacillus polymachus]|uniref:SH3 domain-containing protein n=1 Tax=Ectobacillus polymachus TaxID=1508806 RepID=UPI003A8C7C66
MKSVLASIAAVSVVGGAVAEVAQAAPEVQAAPVSADQQHTQSSNDFTVQADSLHVRKGPSTSDEILGHVMQGDALKVLGEVQGWYQVQYNGQTAYVSKDFLAQSASAPDNDYKVTVSSLRVRTGPSTSHDVIGDLSRGDVVQVVGELQNWYKISYKGQTAYVSKDYVSHGGQDQTVTQSLQTGELNGSYIVDVPSLRIRTGAAIYHPVIGGVTQGEVLKVTGIENGWYKIDRGGKTGYVSAQYVKFEPKTTDYYVTADGLNIRSGAGAQSDILNTITRGDKVQVSGEDNGWFKVTFNGQTGYINKKYVSQAQVEAAKSTNKADAQVQAKSDTKATEQANADSTPAPQAKAEQPTVQTQPAGNEQAGSAVKQPAGNEQAQPAAKAQDYYVKTSSLNVRSGAGTQFDAIGSVSYGDKVKVTGEDNGWLKISYNGQTGYIGKSFVSDTKVDAIAQANETASAPAPTKEKTQSQASAQSQAPAKTQTQPQAPAQNQKPASPSSNVSALLSYAKSLEGTPYKWGGTTPGGFDCSGFIYHVYNKFGFSFGRQSANGYWNSLTQTTNPQPGDFVYFQGTTGNGSSSASHMGIYLGNGTFISAADNGVTVSSVNNSYWSKHFLGYSKPY